MQKSKFFKICYPSVLFIAEEKAQSMSIFDGKKCRQVDCDWTYWMAGHVQSLVWLNGTTKGQHTDRICHGPADSQELVSIWWTCRDDDTLFAFRQGQTDEHEKSVPVNFHDDDTPTV